MLLVKDWWGLVRQVISKWLQKSQNWIVWNCVHAVQLFLYSREGRCCHFMWCCFAIISICKICAVRSPFIKEEIRPNLDFSPRELGCDYVNLHTDTQTLKRWLHTFSTFATVFCVFFWAKLVFVSEYTEIHITKWLDFYLCVCKFSLWHK